MTHNSKVSHNIYFSFYYLQKHSSSTLIWFIHIKVHIQSHPKFFPHKGSFQSTPSNSNYISPSFILHLQHGHHLFIINEIQLLISIIHSNSIFKSSTQNELLQFKHKTDSLFALKWCFIFHQMCNRTFNFQMKPKIHWFSLPASKTDSSNSSIQIHLYYIHNGIQLLFIINP